MGEVDVDEEIAEEGNVDEEEEGDAAVLCRNAQCLGSLLQSWVVESFLEVRLIRIYFKHPRKYLLFQGCRDKVGVPLLPQFEELPV